MILNEEIKKNILKKFQNKKIAVLYGGISEEREVSLRSGENVYKALTSFEEIKDNCISIEYYAKSKRNEFNTLKRIC